MLNNICPAASLTNLHSYLANTEPGATVVELDDGVARVQCEDGEQRYVWVAGSWAWDGPAD